MCSAAKLAYQGGASSAGVAGEDAGGAVALGSSRRIPAVAMVVAVAPALQQELDRPMEG